MSMSMSMGYICPSTEGQQQGSASNNLSGDPSSNNDNSGSAPRVRVINPIGTVGWQAPELMTHLRSHVPSTAEAPITVLSGTEEQDEDEDDDVDEEEDDDEEYGDEEEQGGEDGCREGAVESGSGLTSARLRSRRAQSKGKSRDRSSEDMATLMATESEVSGDSSSLKSSATQKACKAAIASSSSSLSKQKKPLQLLQQQSVRKRTQKCDIFSAGLVYFYVLVPGEHPFGQWFEREANIMTGKSDLSRLDDMPDAADLVRRMLASDPDLRPTAAQVYRHPFFWNAQRRLEFLVDLSDRLEHESVTAAPVLALEANAATVVGRGGWDRNLDPGLLLDMNKYRKYDSHCVRDLLRVVRNKR